MEILFPFRERTILIGNDTSKQTHEDQHLQPFRQNIRKQD